MDLPEIYRPSSLDEVIGQDAVVASLGSFLRDETPAHTFVFTGPSGVGKTTIARILARELGCDLASNLIEVDGATHTGVDSWRELQASAKYSPLSGDVRCIIVDEAHAISKASWQSLLKITEEPPEHLYWMFCTTEAGRIPSTIATRSLWYELRSVGADELGDLVESVCEDQGWEVADEIIGVVVEAAQGSPRKALNALAQVRKLETAAEAVQVLRTTPADDADIRELATSLLRGKSWMIAKDIVRKLEDTNAESIRIAVYNISSAAAKSAKTEKAFLGAMNVVSAFATPYPAGSRTGHLLMSIAEALYGEQ